MQEVAHAEKKTGGEETRKNIYAEDSRCAKTNRKENGRWPRRRIAHRRSLGMYHRKASALGIVDAAARTGGPQMGSDEYAFARTDSALQIADTQTHIQWHEDSRDEARRG